MNQEIENLWLKMNRRQALRTVGAGLGYMALGSLLADGSTTAGKFSHHPARAKRIIYLFQSGGPSQVDLFDHKPALAQHHGSDIFKHVEQQSRLTGFNNNRKILPVINSKYSFAQHGQTGSWTSELLPHMAGIADDLCTIRSMTTIPINHDPAMTFMQTGHNLPGRPSMGSWLSYGLGTMNQNLPEFVALVSSGDLPNMQPLNSRLWGNGFLPGKHQGVRLRSGAEPVLYLNDPTGKTLTEKRSILDAINALNREEANRSGDPSVDTRIAQYEMAFRMQTSIPELADFANVNVTGMMSTIGFGSIDQTVNERNKFAERSYGVQSNINLDKVLPSELGVKVPMFFSFSENFKSPQFNPLDPDIEFNRALAETNSQEERDSLRFAGQEYEMRKSINFTNVRKEKGGAVGGAGRPAPMGPKGMEGGEEGGAKSKGDFWANSPLNITNFNTSYAY
ncbi:MAG: DUF1501 domain-containing protein, partial [Opitutae bacterium]|nr:DUF1501 domain-containing protein [Opitutae bacterium]